MLCSATLNNKNIDKWKSLVKNNNLKFIDCNPEEDYTNNNIDEWKILVDDQDKLLLLVSMLKLNLIPLKALIFVNSIEMC